jgi:hypothetical protein
MIVVHITPIGADQYVTMPYRADHGFLPYVPRGSTVYAYDGGEQLWKWVGTHFETITSDENRNLRLDVKTLASKQDYTNVNGWSSRHSLTSWPAKSEIELQGKSVTLFTKVRDSGSEVSLELQIPGRAPQRILRTKRAWHLVSKSQYDRTFNEP